MPEFYIEIDRNVLLQNLINIQNYSKSKISAVVKANAYGHGLKEVVSILDNRVEYFQVDDFIEFSEVRKYSDNKVLVTGGLPEKELTEVIEQRGTACANDVTTVLLLRNISERHNINVGFHLKIDCLLGRQGIKPSEINEVTDIVKSSNFLKIEGAYTHFGDVEDPIRRIKQLKLFSESIKLIKSRNIELKYTHINSTSGMIYEDHKGLNTNLNRIGIGLYGLWHSSAIKEKHKMSLKLEPVLQWKAKISQVKYLERGHPVGYGSIYKTNRKIKIAVIPQGYSDGFDRRLSQNGNVLIKGNYCTVIGYVSMNLFVVDVSHINNVKKGDKVTIIGSNGSKKISADDISQKLETINYEVLSRISPKIPRIIV